MYEKVINAQKAILTLTNEHLERQISRLNHLISQPVYRSPCTCQLLDIYIEEGSIIPKALFNAKFMASNTVTVTISKENHETWQYLTYLYDQRNTQEYINNTEVEHYISYVAPPMPSKWVGLSSVNGELVVTIELERAIETQNSFQINITSKIPTKLFKSALIVGKGPWLAIGKQNLWVLRNKELQQIESNLVPFGKGHFQVDSGLIVGDKVVIYSPINFRFKKEVNLVQL